ncbi:MAG: ATP-dependent DNA helicase [Rubrivivax sp.]
MDLPDAVEAAFLPAGPLARAQPGFRPREPQQRMAREVAQAIEARGTLVAEAGTGVGKTYAYLVPLLLSGRRALVSTATKSLQDQLFLRDLPRLAQALGVPARLALLKGRASYLCLYRLGQARSRAHWPERGSLALLARIEAWAAHTVSGDLAELPGLDESSPLVPIVSSTRENCLGSECPEFARCHVVKARREAMAADLVVVNHHLFFADLTLRETGMAELLPTVDAAVFDEAHQLVDAGLGFLGTSLGTGQLADIARDLQVAGLREARGLRPWVELAVRLEQGGRALRQALALGSRSAGAVARLPWREVSSQESVARCLQEVQDAAAEVRAALEAVLELHPELRRLGERVEALQGACASFGQEAGPDRVRWVEVGASWARFVESPLDIARALTEQRERARQAWIFTSATLGDDERLAWFVSRTGTTDATVLRVGSPFDYAEQARLWVPNPFPRPAAPEHPAEVARLAARCAGLLGGRTFVLTTTLRVLPLVARLLREALASVYPPIEVLVQGEQPRRALVQRFGDGRGRLLIGSQSFWEGIDMPGDALQCVVIDKLPFPPPDDPLVEARGRQIRARGGEPFAEVFVAEAAVSLKQGAGRLIRTERDEGLLVVCDPRLSHMGYGRRLQAALPPMRPLSEIAEVVSWLQGLATRHGPA